MRHRSGLSRRIVALTLSLYGLLFAALAAAKPNVLLIAVDDLNNNLACYGHPQVRSPHIDRLAARGVRFERAYCQYPLCNPSRVSLLSGRRPDTTGIMDLTTPPRTHLKNVVFLPQYFRQQGYYTAHVGKIFHTGPEFEDPPSWDHEIRETGKHPPENKVARGKRVERPNKNSLEWAELVSSDAETADGLVAQQAVALLRERERVNSPFFLGVGFRRPHAPYAAPRNYFDLYPTASIPPLIEPQEHLRSIPAAALTIPPGSPPLADEDRREIVRAYWACITFVDTQIGAVLDALDDAGLAANTIVVLYGDHGYHLGEHGGLLHKMSLFEESARVPLVVRSPRAAGNGQSCQRLVEFVDLYPTLVDLCGLPPMAGLEGKSLRPLLDNPRADWTDAAYTQVVHVDATGRSVRTSRWRYTEWNEGRAGRELYDHEADPHEYVNLADDPRSAATVAELSQLLRPASPHSSK
jgi:iduronate 2-sulfatase